MGIQDETIVVDVSTKHHGIALWPPPSNDPKDPLRWHRWLKILAVVSAALFNFTANFAGAGPSVAAPLFGMEFRKTPAQVNSLLTLNFLLLGLGNLFWVPISVKFGKRFALLTSMAILFASLCWSAKASSFKSLLAARCVSGFAAAAGESIVPGIVSDMFFLHEHASMMSIFIIMISSGTAIGPLIAAYMVQYSPGTWRDFVWLSAALAGFNLILTFTFYPESNFHRPEIHSSADPTPRPSTIDEQEKMATSAHVHIETGQPSHVAQHVDHVHLSWISIWTTFWTVDKTVNLAKAMARPLLFLVYPAVFWNVLVYGAALGAQVVLIFAFPSLLLAPPYLFAPSSVGLMQIPALIGFVFAMFGGGWLTDIITTRQIRKHGGVVKPEQRLVSLILGALVGPVGCIIIAFACSKHLHWAAIAVGFGMVSFGTVYGPNIAITYVIESYPDFATETLVIVNAFKNLVAFIFIYVAVDWVNSSGWVQVYMIFFMLVSLTMLLALPLYIFGQRMRSWMSTTKLHRRFLVEQ